MPIVRASKYRHVFGNPTKRDLCHDNLKVSKNAWDTNLCCANPLFVSVNLETGGGGSFAVLTHAQIGKLPENMPVVTGHAGAVLDTAFNPFNDTIIASASEDQTAMVWTIPQNGLTENIIKPALTLSGHGRKVGQVMWHPTAENVLTTASADFTVKLWDVAHGTEKQMLTGHTEIIQSLTWNHDGSLLATTCKDKKIRVFDVRANKVVFEGPGHQGIKGSRVIWLGNLNKLATTGFSKTSDRQVFLWDSANLSQPLKQEHIDTASGTLMPHYDQDSNLLFLAGKGDGNIRYYEFVDDDTSLYFLSEYKSADPQRGIAWLPKRAVNTAEVEIARAFKVHVTCVEPISFRVPRKAEGFQADLYPETDGAVPALTADEFFSGKSRSLKRISLVGGYVPQVIKEFVPSVTLVEEKKAPQNEKEYQDGYHALRKENEGLKNEVSQRDVKIRQLEAQLESFKKE